MKVNFSTFRIDDERKVNPALDKYDKICRSEVEKEEFCYISDGISNNFDQLDFSSLDKYDLILVDFELKDTKGGKGISMIEAIRAHSISCEILFYSSHTDFEEILINHCQTNKKYIESVFITEKKEALIQAKIAIIVQLIDKKVNNLNTMRGLVLAETADLDYILCEIIDKLYDKLGINKNNYLYIKNTGINPSSRDFTTHHNRFQFPYGSYSFTDRLKSTGTNELFCEMCSNNRSPLYSGANINFITNINKYRNFYKNERNNLAHGKTQPNANGTMSANGVPYSISNLKAMRKQLLEFRECFEKMRDSI